MVESQPPASGFLTTGPDNRTPPANNLPSVAGLRRAPRPARFRAARQLALARGVAMLGLWFQELEQGKTGVPEGGRAAARLWATPHGLASVAFHILHIAGSTN